MQHSQGLALRQMQHIEAQLSPCPIRPMETLRIRPLTPVMPVTANNMQLSLKAKMPSKAVVRSMGMSLFSRLAIPQENYSDMDLGGANFSSLFWNILNSPVI